MKITKYIFKENLSPSLIGLLLFTFVLLMNHLFLLAREAIQKEIPLHLVLELLALESPKIIVLTIPMSILFGILIGIGRLVSDSEIIAFHASGVSARKMLIATLYLSFIAMLISLGIYFYVVPASEFKIRTIRNEIFLKSDIAKDIKSRIFYDRLEGFIIYADEIKAGTKLMERVFIKQEGSKKEPERLSLAQQGFITKDEDSGLIRLTLQNGETHLFSKNDPDAYRMNRFSHLTITIESYREMYRNFAALPQKGIQDQTLRELLAELGSVKKNPDDPASKFRIRRILAEVHQRIAIPFVSIAFCFVAFPLAMMNIRGGKGGGFALSILVIIVFWVIFMIGKDIALEEKVPVWLGIWGANLMMLFIGVFLWFSRKMNLKNKLKLEALFISFQKLYFFLPDLRASLKRRRARYIRIEKKKSARSGFMLSMIDRYIVVTFLKVFLFIGLTIYVISIIVELKSLIDSVVERDLPFTIILDYFKFYTPGLMRYIIPIASMMAAVITVALFSRFSETIAIKASGISAYRMILPIIIVSFLFSALFYLVQDYILPYTNQKALMLRDTIEGRKGISYGMLHGRWLAGKGKRFFNYKNYESSPPTLTGVSVYEISESDFSLKKRIEAERCYWNGKSWEFENGWQRSFDDEISYEKFQLMAFLFDEGADYFEAREKTFFGASRIPEQMSYFELRDYINTLRTAGYDTTSLRVGMHEKLSFPLTSLIMVLVSIPFAFLIGKKGSLYGVGISLLIIIVYWALFAISNALGHEGILPPFLSAWAPNIIFGLAGLWGIFNTRT